jgi:hypothetical protein
MNAREEMAAAVAEMKRLADEIEDNFLGCGGAEARDIMTRLRRRAEQIEQLLSRLHVN